MRSCPYCLAEVPEQARKCKHCGEWLDGEPEERRPRSRGRFDDESLGRAANRFVSFQVVVAIVGIVLALVFFFGFFLPSWNERKERFDERWDSFPRREVPDPPSGSR